MRKKLHRLKQQIGLQDGAETVEYALVVGLFAVASMVALATLGTDISSFFDKAAELVRGMPGP